LLSQNPDAIATAHDLFSARKRDDHSRVAAGVIRTVAMLRLDLAFASLPSHGRVKLAAGKP
jgi:hypothetical protein